MDDSTASLKTQRIQVWAAPIVTAAVVAALTLIPSSPPSLSSPTQTLTQVFASSLSTISPEESTSSVGYILMIIGYLLLPGIGVLLMRRKRALARIALDSNSNLSLDPVSSCIQITSFITSVVNSHTERRVDSVTHTHSWDSETQSIVQCAVCLEELHTGDCVRTLKCSHSFHKPCADLWFVSTSKTCCPMCMACVFNRTHQ